VHTAGFEAAKLKLAGMQQARLALPGQPGNIAQNLPGRKPMKLAIYMVQVNDGDRVMRRNQFRTMGQSAIIN
jgi:hypothetical protein